MRDGSFGDFIYRTKPLERGVYLMLYGGILGVCLGKPLGVFFAWSSDGIAGSNWVYKCMDEVKELEPFWNMPNGVLMGRGLTLEWQKV